MIRLFFVCSLLISITCRAQQWNGLTYYNTNYGTSSQLLDTNGTNVKTWNWGTPAGYSSHMMPGGFVYRTVLVSTPMSSGGTCGKFQKWDYAGNLLWDMNYFGSTYVTHHDICPLPNGNVLAICYDLKTPAQVAAVGGPSMTIWSERIIEFKQTGPTTGTIVWQWDLWDHLVQNVNSSKPNYYPSIVAHPELLNINYSPQQEWLHANGVDYNPVLDQIAFSSHYLNEWYIIDHSTTTAEAASHVGGNAGKGGDFLYRWGNPAAYQAPGTATFNVTHDAHWVQEGSPGAGDLAGVNNYGITSPSYKTTIDQITPPRVDYNYTIMPNGAYGPTVLTNRYITGGASSNQGSSQEMPNGNRLICQAMSGFIFEIDPAGSTLWSINTGDITVQAHRYSQCFISNPAPPQPSISVSGMDLVSTSGVTYQWYCNGNMIIGANTQTYTPTQNGIYVVRTTDANGCVYAYSAGYKYNLIMGIKEAGSFDHPVLYPNPVTEELTIDIKDKNWKINKVYDISGREIKVETYISGNKLKIKTSSLQSGTYFVELQNERGRSTLKFQKTN